MFDSMKNPRIIYAVFIVISIICFGLSVTIEVEKLNNPASLSNICVAISSGSQCNKVQNSAYGKSFGLDNAFYGMIGFTIMLILSVLQFRADNKLRRILVLLGSFIAGVMAIWFLYIQMYILKSYCVFCVIVDCLSILMLALAIFLSLYYLRRR